jgi:hypothetical protein
LLGQEERRNVSEVIGVVFQTCSWVGGGDW